MRPLVGVEPNPGAADAGAAVTWPDIEVAGRLSPELLTARLCSRASTRDFSRLTNTSDTRHEICAITLHDWRTRVQLVFFWYIFLAANKTLKTGQYLICGQNATVTNTTNGHV